MRERCVETPAGLPLAAGLKPVSVPCASGPHHGEEESVFLLLPGCRRRLCALPTREGFAPLFTRRFIAD